MNDTTTIGIFAGVVISFLGIAKVMLNQATKDREADRKERKELSLAISLMAKNSNKVAEATVRSADEAKQRNGHLAELVMQSNENTRVLAEKATKDIIAAVGMQHIDVQKVEHQTVTESKQG